MCHDLTTAEVKEHTIGYAWVTDMGRVTTPGTEYDINYQGVLRCVGLKLVGTSARKAKYPEKYQVLRDATGTPRKNLFEVGTDSFFYWWEYTARLAEDGLFIACGCEDCQVVAVGLLIVVDYLVVLRISRA